MAQYVVQLPPASITHSSRRFMDSQNGATSSTIKAAHSASKISLSCVRVWGARHSTRAFSSDQMFSCGWTSGEKDGWNRSETPLASAQFLVRFAVGALSSMYRWAPSKKAFVTGSISLLRLSTKRSAVQLSPCLITSGVTPTDDKPARTVIEGEVCGIPSLGASWFARHQTTCVLWWIWKFASSINTVASNWSSWCKRLHTCRASRWRAMRAGPTLWRFAENPSRCSARPTVIRDTPSPVRSSISLRSLAVDTLPPVATEPSTKSRIVWRATTERCWRLPLPIFRSIVPPLRRRWHTRETVDLLRPERSEISRTEWTPASKRVLITLRRSFSLKPCPTAAILLGATRREHECFLAPARSLFFLQGTSFTWSCRRITLQLVLVWVESTMLHRLRFLFTWFSFYFTPETKNFSGRRAWRTSQPTRPQRKMLRRSHSGPAPLDLLWSNGITWRERSNFTVTSCTLTHSMRIHTQPGATWFSDVTGCM